MLRVNEKPTPYGVLIERYATLTLARGHLHHLTGLLDNCGLTPVATMISRPLRRIERELVRVRRALKLTEPEP